MPIKLFTSKEFSMHSEMESSMPLIYLAADHMDIAEAPQHAVHEDGDNVEPQAKIEAIITNKEANRKESSYY